MGGEPRNLKPRTEQISLTVTQQHIRGDRELDSSTTYNMSSTSSEAVPGTKAHSSSDLANSSKRRRLDDDYSGWAANYIALLNAYDQLTSKKFFLKMNRGNLRVERLFSKATESGLDDDEIVRLKQLVASFADLLTSLEILRHDESDNEEMVRLVHLAKQILQEWDWIEKTISQHEQSLPRVHPLCMAPVDYPHVVPSAWLFEYHWHDSAHKEVVSIRQKYSYVLDEAYLACYTSYLKKNGISGSILLARKKLLNFLGSSREDFEFRHFKKCYRRVLSIKELCALLDPPLGLASPRAASGNLTDGTKVPNWRDDIYDRVAAVRKMYSVDMDRLLKDEVNKAQSATPDEVNKEWRNFLEKSLQFLVNYRDGIAILEDEYCREELARIKHRMEEFFPANQSAATPESRGLTRLPKGKSNWRDLEYAALQNKLIRFSYEVHDVYLKHKPIWTKIPECNEDLKKLESHMKRALQIYNMGRGEMSLLENKRDYYYGLCDTLKEHVLECIGLIKRLLCFLEEDWIKPRWDISRPDLLIPKGTTLCHQLS